MKKKRKLLHLAENYGLSQSRLEKGHEAIRVRIFENFAEQGEFYYMVIDFHFGGEFRRRYHRYDCASDYRYGRETGSLYDLFADLYKARYFENELEKKCYSDCPTLENLIRRSREELDFYEINVNSICKRLADVLNGYI